jgi:anti-sigma factor RsiW
MTPVRSDRCRELLVRVSRYVDGDLGGVERRALTAHLRRCPCCSSMAESLKHTVCLCRDASATRLPPAVRARAKARVEALLASESKTGNRARPSKRPSR